MKKFYTFCVFSLIISGTALSQKKTTVKIHYFDKLETNDQNELINIRNKVFKDKKYDIKLINVYGKMETSFAGKEDFDYLPNAIENTDFKDDKDYSKLYPKVIHGNAWTYDFDRTDKNTLITDNCKTWKQLKKRLKEERKKIKKDNPKTLNLVWLNRKVDYKFGMKNLEKVYQTKKKNNKLSELAPKINSPSSSPSSKRTLRPDESHYTIEFDSVGYFDKYEVEINCTSTSMQRTIFKEILIFTDEYDKNKDFFMWYTNDRNKCEILISAKYLAEICYELTNQNLNLNSDVPSFSDQGCDLCKYKCLYEKRYEIKIRGLVDNFAKEDLWYEVPLFHFQCPKPNN